VGANIGIIFQFSGHNCKWTHDIVAYPWNFVRKYFKLSNLSIKLLETIQYLVVSVSTRTSLSGTIAERRGVRLQYHLLREGTHLSGVEWHLLTVFTKINHWLINDKTRIVLRLHILRTNHLYKVTLYFINGTKLMCKNILPRILLFLHYLCVKNFSRRDIIVGSSPSL
jgi:hypothetical protein